MTTNSNTAHKNVTTFTGSKDAIKLKQQNGVVMELVDANVAFPEVFNKGESKVWRRLDRSEYCLDSNPFYKPNEAMLRFSLRLIFSKKQNLLPLGLYGETGTGKTEMIMYIADRLNQPLMIQKCTPYMTSEQLEGDRELIGSSNGVITAESASPLLRAVEEGMWVIFDEADKLNADATSSLHLVLEKKPWNLNVFKRIVKTHPNCKMFATANTLGEGDSPRYTSSNQLDAAFRRRFGWVMMDFPEAFQEMNIITSQFPNLPAKLVGEMVKTANSFRDALLGPKRDGNTNSTINCVFSTATIVNWSDMIEVYGDDGTIMDALKFAFWGSVDPDSHEVATDIIKAVWGGNENITIAEVKTLYSPKK